MAIATLNCQRVMNTRLVASTHPNKLSSSGIMIPNRMEDTCTVQQIIVWNHQPDKDMGRGQNGLLQ